MKLTWVSSLCRDGLTHNFALCFEGNSFLPAGSGCIGGNLSSKEPRPQMNIAYSPHLWGRTWIGITALLFTGCETLDN